MGAEPKKADADGTFFEVGGFEGVFFLLADAFRGDDLVGVFTDLDFDRFSAGTSLSESVAGIKELGTYTLS